MTMDQNGAPGSPPSKSNSRIQLLVFVLIVAGSLFLNFAPVGKLVVKNVQTSNSHSQSGVAKMLLSSLQPTTLPMPKEVSVLTSANETAKNALPKGTPTLLSDQPLNPPSKVTREDCTNYGKHKDQKLAKMSVQSVTGRLNSTLNAPFIRKKHVQGRPRVLFVAGLEGTGHHMIDSSLKDVCSHFDSPSRVKCRASSAMHSVVGACSASWNFDKMRTPEGKKKFMGQLKKEVSQTDELVVINSLRPKNQFFNAQSYPDCGRPRINGQFPDMRLLAEYLEEAGMDLRVVVMHRQVIDSYLISTTIKREFAPSFDVNIITAYQMLTYLLAQISVIDPKFIAGCFHLDMEQQKFSHVMHEIDHALNTTLFGTRMVANFRQHSSQPCINESQFSGVWMQRLIEKWDEMRRFCDQFVTQVT